MMRAVYCIQVCEWCMPSVEALHGVCRSTTQPSLMDFTPLMKVWTASEAALHLLYISAAPNECQRQSESTELTA